MVSFEEVLLLVQALAPTLSIGEATKSVMTSLELGVERVSEVKPLVVAAASMAQYQARQLASDFAAAFKKNAPDNEEEREGKAQRKARRAAKRAAKEAKKQEKAEAARKAKVSKKTKQRTAKRSAHLKRIKSKAARGDAQSLAWIQKRKETKASEWTKYKDKKKRDKAAKAAAPEDPAAFWDHFADDEITGDEKEHPVDLLRDLFEPPKAAPSMPRRELRRLRPYRDVQDPDLAEPLGLETRRTFRPVLDRARPHDDLLRRLHHGSTDTFISGVGWVAIRPSSD